MKTTPAVEAIGLGKQYRNVWSLRDCSFNIPRGRIAALVGPNGAGKSTLLRLLAGISSPNEGSVRVFGAHPSTQDMSVLSKMAYLDQDRPLYKDFRVRDMLRFGRELNPHWDNGRALRHLESLDIPLSARVGHLSGGKQAQVALTLCVAKCPDLLLLDEPVASLDPVARAHFIRMMADSVGKDEITVVLSSHAIADLSAVCDYVIIMSSGRVQVADDLNKVIADHRLLVSDIGATPSLPQTVSVISSSMEGRQSSLLVRAEETEPLSGWTQLAPNLDEIVMAYLRAGAAVGGDRGASGRGRRNEIRVLQ